MTSTSVRRALKVFNRALRLLFPINLSSLAQPASCASNFACASPRSVDAMLAYAEAEAENLIRENLNVVLALVDALVASPKDKLTAYRSTVESAMDREHHLTFDVGRRADWRCVEI